MVYIPSETEATGSKFERKVFDAQTVEGRIVEVVDIGMQEPPEQYAFNDNGKRKRPSRKLNITVEVPDLKVEMEIDGKTVEKPARFYKEATLSVDDKAVLKSVLKAAGAAPGMEFKLENMIGMGVAIEVDKAVSKAGNPYNKVKSIAPVSAKMDKLIEALEGDPLVFDFDNPDIAAYEKLNNFMKEKLSQATNFPGSKLAKLLNGGGEAQSEEAPF